MDMKSSRRINYVINMIVVVLLVSIIFGALILILMVINLQKLYLVLGIIMGVSLYGLILYMIIFKFFVPIQLTQKAVSNLKQELYEINKDYVKYGKEIAINLEINELISTLKDSANREYLESMLKKQAQLDNLQSQINPHFLYNILDSVRGDVLARGLTETADMIEALSKFFRYGIGSSIGLITFEEEYKNVENYMKIQRYRFGDRITLINDFDRKDNNIMNFKLPKMTLQPLVENAITHGIEGKLTKGKIVIRVSYTDRRMLITVEDNGIGMNEEILEKLNRKLNDSSKEISLIDSKSNGVALLNVSERIKLLFGIEFGLYINSAEGLGTEAHISLPYKEGDRS